MVIEYARNVAGIADASSSEFDPGTAHPVIATMEEQKAFVEGAGDLGGTMRLGTYPAHLTAGSVLARDLRHATRVDERHRHRYEVNNAYREQLEEAGLRFAGTSPDGTLVEFVELPADVHPYYVSTQAHPEFLSRPHRAHPLFAGPGRVPRSTPSAPPGWSRSSARRRPRRCRRRDAGRADGARRGAGGPAASDVRSSTASGSSRAWSGTSCATPSTSARAGRSRREYIQHPGAVAVVALDDRGRVLLIQQYRHPVGTFEWELPAGLLDVAGEPPWQAAARELHEEADLEAGRWDVLMDYYASPGRGERGAADLPGPRPRPTCRTATGTPARARSSACPRAGSTSTRPTTPCCAASCTTRRAVIGILAAHAARARDWSTLRPHDAAWPEHPAYR